VSRRRAAAAAVAFGALGVGGFAAAAVTTVTLTGAGPQPGTLTVNWGDTVVFSNGDAQSHVVSIPRLTVASPPIPPGGSFSQAFEDRIGNYIFRQVAARAFQGTIVVALNGTLTLTGRPSSVQFGRNVTFQGRSPYPGRPVILEQLPPGTTTWTQAAQVVAGTDGAFSTSLAPQIGARYRATAAAGQLRSGPIAVSVRPRLTLTVTPRRGAVGRRAVVRARVTPVDAVRRLDFEVYEPRRRRWSRVATRAVARNGTVTFRWAIRSGSSRVRVSVRRVEVRQGFDQATSAIVVVRGG
jgi:plastocyanin